MALFGWLLIGGIAAGGSIRSARNRSEAKSQGYDVYFDSCGKARYTDSNLLQNSSYEELKNDDRYNKKVRFWEKALADNKEECEKNPYLKEMYEKKIAEAKAEAEKTCQSMAHLDYLTEQRLKKQGYKF